jgi:chemotaxis-related protein WspB
MLVLTFQVGREALALDIRRVREVVPRVRLRPISGAPEWLAGVFVYRGQVIPVIDLHRLSGGAECPPHLSSRIILVPLGRADGGERLLGLLATQVADIREVPAAPPASAASPLPFPTVGGQGPDLGAVVADGPGVLRLLDPERLLPGAAWRSLLALPGEGSP